MVLEKTLTFPIKNSTGEENKDKITLTLKFKELTTTNNYIIHRAYLTQKYNERQGTANTLTRAEVKGGGRKPWRQKGTGRARAGSNRSPLWKGGGVSFGSKPKIYFNKINRKEWRLGLRTLLLSKESNITIINDLNFLELKTSSFLKNLNQFGINLFESILIIVPELDKNLLKVTRNVKTINFTIANNLNIRQILVAKHILITKEALKKIEETYNG